MKQAIELLSSSDFVRAADEQRQIINKLEALKKLLTGSDLDLQLQLERLRALNNAIAKLDAATKEEKRQHDRSGEIAKAPPADPKVLDPLKQDQQQNRRATDNIAQELSSLGAGAAQAGATLGGASQAMSLAEGQLGAGKPGDAQKNRARRSMPCAGPASNWLPSKRESCRNWSVKFASRWWTI